MRDAVRNRERGEGAARLPKILVLLRRELKVLWTYHALGVQPVPYVCPRRGCAAQEVRSPRPTGALRGEARSCSEGAGWARLQSTRCTERGEGEMPSSVGAGQRTASALALPPPPPPPPRGARCRREPPPGVEEDAEGACAREKHGDWRRE